MARPKYYSRTVAKGSQHYNFSRPRTGWSVSGNVDSKGPVQLVRKSASANGNGFTPTNYSMLKQSYGGTFTSVSRLVYAINDSFTTYTVGQQSGNDTVAPSSYFDSPKFGVFNPGVNPEFTNFVTIPGRMQELVANRLLSKVDNQSIALGTTLAELASTVSYVSGRAQEIVQFGSLIISGRWKSALKKVGISKKRWTAAKKKSILEGGGIVAKEVASRWLELGFAILPTMGEVADVARLYDDPHKALGQVKLRASASLSISEEIDDTDSSTPDWITKTQSQMAGYCRMKTTYSVFDPEVVAQKALGINNVPAAIYEGIPFSWLLDYVINIGDFLSAMTATEGLTFQHGYVSLRANCSSSYNRQYDKSNGLYGEYHTSSNIGSSYMEGYARLRLTAFPKPTIQVVISDLTKGKVSNIIALGTVLTTKATKVAHF